jgi:TonB family C-terminal domain
VPVGRSWLLSAVLHLGVVVTIFLLSIHPGRVLAPVSSKLQSGLVHANLLTTLPSVQAGEASSSLDNHSIPIKVPERVPPAIEVVPVKPVSPKPKRVVKKTPPSRQSKKEQKNTLSPSSHRAPVPQPHVESQEMPVFPSSDQSGKTGQTTEIKGQTSQPDNSGESGVPRLVSARYDGAPTPATYPIAARRLGQEGLVVVEVWLDKDGKQDKRQVKRSSGFALLDKAALETVAKNRFLPFSEGGSPKPSRLLVPIAFKLQGQ